MWQLMARRYCKPMRSCQERRPISEGKGQRKNILIIRLKKKHIYLIDGEYKIAHLVTNGATCTTDCGTRKICVISTCPRGLLISYSPVWPCDITLYKPRIFFNFCSLLKILFSGVASRDWMNFSLTPQLMMQLGVGTNTEQVTNHTWRRVIKLIYVYWKLNSRRLWRWTKPLHFS